MTERINAFLRSEAALLKTCKRCGETKSVDEFHKAGMQNGKQMYKSICAKCKTSSKHDERMELLADGKKRCRVCNEVLPLDSFYDGGTTRDGKRSECKPCFNRDIMERRKTTHGHAVFIRAKRKYNARPESRQKHTEYMRNVRATGRWYQQENARKRLWDAVRRNGFPRPTEHKCADCGQPAQEYHHESYEREHWLDVVPLCRECHRSRHSAERN